MLLFAHMGFALAAARFTPRANLFFVALGSMLPDIIDKPLGQIVFGTPAMGRTFIHTLLFLILLATAAYYLRSICLASLAGGVSIHLALDFMWASPQTLFWPLLGGFPLGPYMDALTYIETLLMELRHPGVLMTELLGLGYIFFLALRSRKNIVIAGREFIAKGQESAQMIVQVFIKWS
ncbi:MAG: metal-dependent hydrolase [Methanotrichaceae archaeon]|nr:metal-dependent hydrolase [Methanotrichaceae archaeon]